MGSNGSPSLSLEPGGEEPSLVVAGFRSRVVAAMVAEIVKFRSGKNSKKNCKSGGSRSKQRCHDYIGVELVESMIG